MTTASDAFQTALDSFVADGQRLIDEDFARHYPALAASGRVPKLSAEVPKGQTYIRIVKNDGSQKSVWAFVVATDVATKSLRFIAGDVAKPASWKTPAKHARGNILASDNGLTYVSAYGPAYR